MRRERRWRYYCDFCKKSGGSGGHIRRHERGCTSNPERHCGMCDAAELVQRPLPELLGALAGGMDALREAADSCPACILAAIVQTEYEVRPHEALSFNFKAERDEFWEAMNEYRAEAEAERYFYG